jgi:hypothetical protein
MTEDCMHFVDTGSLIENCLLLADVVLVSQPVDPVYSSAANLELSGLFTWIS